VNPRPASPAGTGWSAARAEEHLLGLELFGMRFGLERMRRLLTVLGSPQERFGAIHVVGTNGKSSTVRMTAALLEAHGVRTGSFLSPHLTSFAERIRIGDSDLGPEAFGATVQRAAEAAAKVDRRLEKGDRVTQFEVLTAAAARSMAPPSSSGSRSRSPTRMRSANEMRCGERNAPVRAPCASSSAAVMRTVELLPFVPTTWIAQKRSCGDPSTVRRRRMRSRPKRMPNSSRPSRCSSARAALQLTSRRAPP